MTSPCTSVESTSRTTSRRGPAVQRRRLDGDVDPLRDRLGGQLGPQPGGVAAGDEQLVGLRRPASTAGRIRSMLAPQPASRRVTAASAAGPSSRGQHARRGAGRPGPRRLGVVERARTRPPPPSRHAAASSAAAHRSPAGRRRRRRRAAAGRARRPARRRGPRGVVRVQHVHQAGGHPGVVRAGDGDQHGSRRPAVASCTRRPGPGGPARRGRAASARRSTASRVSTAPPMSSSARLTTAAELAGADQQVAGPRPGSRAGARRRRRRPGPAGAGRARASATSGRQRATSRSSSARGHLDDAAAQVVLGVVQERPRVRAGRDLDRVGRPATVVTVPSKAEPCAVSVGHQAGAGAVRAQREDALAGLQRLLR